MSFALATNQQINNYYDTYRDNEIVFTKDILKTLRLDPRQVYVKCGGGQWPCIINSTSFQFAKIIIGTTGGAYAQITKKDAPTVNLRYCFLEQDNTPLHFFVSCHVTEVTPYMNSKDLAVVTLTFTQRPPDDLILKLGSLIDANYSFTRRREERIILNKDSLRKLGLDKKETIIFIQEVPRRCILVNISFSGARVVFIGRPQFLKGKNVVIRLMFSDPNETIDVKGTIMSLEELPDRKELVQAGIQFDESQVPLAYKMRINDYLASNRKLFLERNEKKLPTDETGSGLEATETTLEDTKNQE